MSVTVGTVTNSNASTFAHNNNMGAVVLVFWGEASGTDPTGATYNGIAMTLAKAWHPWGDGVWCYYLIGAPLGNYNVVVSWAPTTPTDYYTALSVNGIGNVGILTFDNSASTDVWSKSIACTPGSILVGVFDQHAGAAACTPGAGVTETVDPTTGGMWSGYMLPTATPSTFGVTWTGNYYASTLLIVEFKLVAGGSPMWFF